MYKVSSCGRSTFAVDGKDCKVNREVERVLKDFHKAGKPIGYVCQLEGHLFYSVSMETTYVLLKCAAVIAGTRNSIFRFVSVVAFKCVFQDVRVCRCLCQSSS